MCQIVKISFTQITHLKSTFLTPSDIKSYSTFLFDINSKGVVFTKLVSQLKLLPGLSEFQDNDTIVMSTIRKDCKAFYFHKQTDANSDGIFSALKHVKAYLRRTMGNHMGKQPTARSNVGACSH